MRKIITTTVILAFQVAAVAQTVNLHFKNGQILQFPSTNVDYVDFSENTPDPVISTGKAIDLGLSVYWSSCNIGAEAPEDYGDYFAWGETKGKRNYLKSNYTYYDNDKSQYIEIGEDISGTEYDAATVNWGNDWRMPTHDEMLELIDKCTWDWTQIGGINGFKVTGSNGNSIFIPAAGNNITNMNGVYAWYFTSTQYSSGFVYELSASSNAIYGDLTTEKYRGYPIRPVTNNLNAGREQ